MRARVVVITLVVAGMAFIFSGNGFCESKDELLKKLNDAKTEYYQKKYEVDNEVRVLGRQWHLRQMDLHEKLKSNPDQERAVKAELWEGAKELSQKKKALYDQLTPLRKKWYNTRMEVEAKIKAIDDAEAAKRD
jgi:hypothetical protein